MIMHEEKREIVESLERFDAMIDADGIVRFMAGLYHRGSGGFYYSNSARDTEGFFTDIESTSQAVVTLSSLGLFDHRTKRDMPEWFWRGLISFFAERQDPCSGYFYDKQFGQAVTDSKKGRNTGQASARLRELGTEPRYPLPSESVGSRGGEGRLSEQYSSVEKFTAWLDAMEWDCDDGHKQYYYGNLLAASMSDIKAAGLLDTARKYISSVQNPDTGLWGRHCNSNAMNAAMKLSFLYDAEHKYPNVEKMIGSVARVVEAEEPYSVATLWNPLVLVRSIIRNYGDIPPSLEERIDENRLPLLRRSIERVARFGKPDGGFSYYPDRSSPTSQGATVSLGLAEGDVNATMLATASMRDTLYAVAGVGIRSFPLRGNAERFFNIAEMKVL